MKGIGGHDERDVLGGGLPDREDEPPDHWRPDEEYWRWADELYEREVDKRLGCFSAQPEGRR